MSAISRIIKRIQYEANHIRDNAKYGKFGKHSKIIRPLMITGKRRIYIGDYVRIRHNGRLETIQIWEGKQLNGKLYIGDRTSIEQCCHIVAADEIRIGNDCVISANVYITDNAHGYDPEESIMGSDLKTKRTTIGNHCFIGIGSCIMEGVELGDNVVIGANSVVTRSIPANSMAAGSPAKVIKKYNCLTHEWIRV